VLWHVLVVAGWERLVTVEQHGQGWRALGIAFREYALIDASQCAGARADGDWVVPGARHPHPPPAHATLLLTRVAVRTLRAELVPRAVRVFRGTCPVPPCVALVAFPPRRAPPVHRASKCPAHLSMRLVGAVRVVGCTTRRCSVGVGRPVQYCYVQLGVHGTCRVRTSVPTPLAAHG
jgi:hypothetical protein